MITFIQANELVKKHETFYRKDLEINGAKVYIYNYLLSDLDAFNDLNGLGKELRGLTIVHDPHEKIYPSMPKFFNLNENEQTQYADFKYKKIKKITEKADGSLIQPISVNGDILMKTKQSFENPQAKRSQEILDSSADLKFFIMDCWDNDFYPLFELIGPDNRVVVDYPENKLVLIGVRDSTGHFVDVNKFKWKYTVKSYDFSLDDLIEKAQSEKDTEGWVVKFTDESILKIKTIDYFQKHRLVLAADSYKNVLEMILDETLDDVLSQVSDKKRNELQKYQNSVATYVAHWTKFCYDESRNVQDRKIVANRFKTNEFFSVIMKAINIETEDEIKKMVIEFMKRKFNKEEKAKRFLKSLAN